jgi:prepilin-type N-terminal cleavage/methylation domain-containing protein
MSATDDHRANGFTLLEALVVLAVTALVTGLAFPALQSTAANWRFRSATTTLAARLSSARATAIAGDRAVNFAAAGDAVVVEDRISRFEPGMTTHTVPGTGITFFPDGSSTGGAVALSDRHRSAAFIVDPASGLAHRAPPA